MIIKFSWESYYINYKFIFEKDDKEFYFSESNRKIKINRKECKIILPEIISEIHPDIIGLVGILIIFPFVGSRIEFSFSVSILLHEVCKKAKIEVMPIGKEILCLKKKRMEKNKLKASIAYSGGIDSTCCIQLFPKNSEIIFLDRIIGVGKRTMYNKDNIYLTLDKLIMEGYSVTIMKSDLEYIRDPIGFPLDICCCIPNLLLSQSLGIDTIVCGYCNSFEDFLDKKIDYFSTGDQILYDRHKNVIKRFGFWDELFGVCNVSLSFPLLGCTEVLTTKIVMIDEMRTSIQSCMRGRINEPCMKCFKCFKKYTILHILKNNRLNENDLLYYLDIIKDEIGKRRYNKDIYSIHELENLRITLLYMVGNYENKENIFMNNLFSKFVDVIRKNKLLFFYNIDGFRYIDKKYHKFVFQKLFEYKCLDLSLLDVI